MGWTLKRTRQCKQCPWRKDVNPQDIPNGYCEAKHRNLKSTIATEGDYSALSSGVLRVMACHETDDAHCIGWLDNQLNAGNNIAMRLKMLSCDNADRIKTVGDQHDCLEDTLPET